MDAVLAGTFVPIKGESAGSEVAPVKSYELRAGIVDTCTGELLLQTNSLVCPGAMEPGLTGGADLASCKHLAASAEETGDPEENAQAFKPLLDDLLFPLEHPVPIAPADALGTVTLVQGKDVTLQLGAHSALRVGDQLSVHASRLAKNPTTYTLHNLQNEEIGRVMVQSVQGSAVHGSFSGDYVPRVGDTAERVAE